jgi:hypothetical protein
MLLWWGLRVWLLTARRNPSKLERGLGTDTGSGSGSGISSAFESLSRSAGMSLRVENPVIAVCWRVFSRYKRARLRSAVGHTDCAQPKRTQKKRAEPAS